MSSLYDLERVNANHGIEQWAIKEQEFFLPEAIYGSQMKELEPIPSRGTQPDRPETTPPGGNVPRI